MESLKTRFIYDDYQEYDLELVYNYPCWLRKGDAVFFDFTDFEVSSVELQINVNEIRIYLERI